MKHKTLRCAAETAALLLTVAMLTFLIAGLHQHEPDRELSTLDTGWYQLTDGVRHEVALPVTLPAAPEQTLTLYNDTLTDSDPESCCPRAAWNTASKSVRVKRCFIATRTTPFQKTHR